MDDISLTIDRLTVAGLPADEREQFATMLKSELRRALEDRFADARAAAEPSPDALRQLVLDVVQQLMKKERRS
ncbi:MAG: hypothetical protein IAE80_01195 [Anaerolinea sp.]|nr:hypothetical protein [Anaerolinea sp.]